MVDKKHQTMPMVIDFDSQTLFEFMLIELIEVLKDKNEPEFDHQRLLQCAQKLAEFEQPLSALMIVWGDHQFQYLQQCFSKPWTTYGGPDGGFLLLNLNYNKAEVYCKRTPTDCLFRKGFAYRMYTPGSLEFSEEGQTICDQFTHKKYHDIWNIANINQWYLPNATIDNHNCSQINWIIYILAGHQCHEVQNRLAYAIDNGFDAALALVIFIDSFHVGFDTDIWINKFVKAFYPKVNIILPHIII